MKTMVFPSTVFGVFGAFSGNAMTSDPNPNLIKIISRVPCTFLYCWSLIFVFDLCNQRLTQSVIEDRINKPWRPIPSGRLTQAQANRWLVMAIPLVLLASATWSGGASESLIFMFLTWLYNDCGGADSAWTVRNLLNGLGIAAYNAGALKVAIGPQISPSPAASGWIAVTAVTIASTIQIQDMEDQKGDALRGRRTMPLVLGDGVTRMVTAVFVVVWSFACPVYWNLELVESLPGVALGAAVAARGLLLRHVSQDRGTFVLWCFWIAVLYIQPLMANL